MAASSVQLVDQAQDAARSICESMQGMGEIQLNMFQRLGAVQQDAFKGTLDAANDRLQLVGKVRGVGEYASAEATLMKSCGQRYVDSVKQVVDVVADTWEAYGERLGKTMDFAMEKATQTAKDAA